MDKPVSLSVKNWIIRNMSVNTMTPELLIETVINHQFESALRAMDTCNSLEFSGFGKFLFNKGKAKKKLLKSVSQMELFERLSVDESASEVRRRNASMKLATAKKHYEYLKNRTNEIS